MKPKTTAAPADSKIRFTYHNGAAGEVLVAGSFNAWLQDTDAREFRMSQGEQGEWTLEVPVPPGTHEYLFVVDGRWTPDPQAKDYVPNPFGGLNSVLVAKSKTKSTTRKRRPRS